MGSIYWKLSWRTRLLLILFSLTLFVSAFLLFWVQLMVAKAILPLLGGSPSVWNACQFFFQSTLLLGYGYSHLNAKWWGTRRGAIAHSLLLWLPLFFLPIAIADSSPPHSGANPIFWLLALLLSAVGLPFFVVSASAPLLQRWFADSDRPGGQDPYFLYSASNLGSLLGLLLYPTLIEPNFSLSSQSLLWASGYGLLIFLTLSCVVLGNGEWGIGNWELGIGNRANSPSSERVRGWVIGIGHWASGIGDKKNRSAGVPPAPSEPGEKEEDKGGKGGKEDLENLENLEENNPQLKTQNSQAQLKTQNSKLKTQNYPQFPIPNSLYPMRLAHWILLAFLPSSLMLGVTTYLTTDLAAIPLLWAIPLALYLLSFILTFAPRTRLPHQTLVILLPLLLASGIILSLLGAMEPVWLWLPWHLGVFFAAACVFHGELARRRPDPEQLTGFYLWIALGGVLGGWFNAIAAPLLFNSILEYPLIMLLGILILDSGSQDSSLKNTRLIALGLLFGALPVGFNPNGFQDNLPALVLASAILVAFYFAFALGWLRLGVGLALIFMLGQFSGGGLGGLLESDRSFFGVNRVIQDRRGEYRVLVHGTTLHGKQSLDPERRDIPLTYFYPNSPIGQFFDNFNSSDRLERVAVLGLGIGTLAAYSQPGQDWTFYEIDPTVARLASDSRYFTFLEDAKASVSIVLGDGRLQLASVPDNSYDAIVMDAFSSDSIPVHLVTREALQLYFQKLRSRGLLAVNISNRYINLEPVLGALARDLGLSALRQIQLEISEAEKKMGKSPSHWVLLARDSKDFGELARDLRWQPIQIDKNTPLWTDDFSDIFSVLGAKQF